METGTSKIIHVIASSLPQKNRSMRDSNLGHLLFLLCRSRLRHCYGHMGLTGSISDSSTSTRPPCRESFVSWLGNYG